MKSIEDTDISKVNRSSVTKSINGVSTSLQDINEHLYGIGNRLHDIDEHVYGIEVSAGFSERYLERIAVALEKIVSGLGYAETPSYHEED